MVDKTVERVLLGLHRLAVGLLPVSLCFWYYRLIVPAEHARVYFVYDNVLFFMSDGVAFLAVTAWLCARLIGQQPPVWAGGQRFLLLTLLALVILASLSTIWSITPTFSIYTAAHLWLMFGLFMSVREEPDSWRAIEIGCVVALILQSSIAGWEFLAQSTAFLAPLHLNWPGTLTPTISGPSVVQLAEGARWLRAYGTLPHPNILGGFLLALMAGPLTIFLRNGARRWWAAGLFGIATIALVLTFSRSAWLGYIAGGTVVMLHRRSLDGLRLRSLAVVALVCLVAVAIPLRSLIFARAPGSQAPTEAGSTYERILLGNQSWAMLRARPLGLGAGAFVVGLAAQFPDTDPVEPVHNVILLTAGELGWLAGLLWLMVGAAIAYEIRRAHGADAAVLSAIVVGLNVIGLGDHYLWSLAPGRTLAWLFLGAWVGSVKTSEHARDDRQLLVAAMSELGRFQTDQTSRVPTAPASSSPGTQKIGSYCLTSPWKNNAILFMHLRFTNAKSRGNQIEGSLAAVMAAPPQRVPARSIPVQPASAPARPMPSDENVCASRSPPAPVARANHVSLHVPGRTYVPAAS